MKRLRSYILPLVVILCLIGIALFNWRREPEPETPQTAHHVSIPEKTPQSIRTPQAAPPKTTPDPVREQLSQYLEDYILIGYVLDRETRNPVEGAKVYHVDSTIRENPQSCFTTAQHGFTTTDVDGRFSMKYPVSGRNFLLVKKEGYSWESNEELARTLPGIPIKIYLRKACGFEGQVLDAATKMPVAGAEISSPRELIGPHSSFLPFPPTAVTDSNGTFRLDGLGKGVWEALFRADGYIPHVAPLMPAKKVTIFLEKGNITLRGKLLTRITHSPAVKKKITFFKENAVPFSTVTDASGDFEISGLLPRAAYWQLKWGKDQLPARGGNIHIRNIPNQEMVLLCTEPVDVRGRVIDRDTKEPVGEGQIQFGWERTSKTFVKLDSDGSFQVTDLMIGSPLQITLFIPGYDIYDPEDTRHFATRQYGSKLFYLENREDLEELSNLTLEVAPSLEVSGKIIDSQSQIPVSGAMVIPAVSFNYDRSHISRSDAQGRFSIDLPREGDSTRLYVCHREYGVKIHKLQNCGDATSQSLTLELSPPLAISGMVRTEQETPLTGVQMKAFLIDGHSQPNREWFIQSAFSDQEGTYTFSPLQDGKYKIEVIAHGFEPSTLNHTLPPEELDVVLESSGILRGRVVDEEMAPMPDLKVYTNPSHAEGCTFTDREGRFTLGGMPKSGEKSIFVQVSNVKSHTERVLFPHEGELLIMIERTGSVQGRVVDVNTGKPPLDYDARVFQEKPKQGYSRRHTRYSKGADGFFEFDSLDAGTYSLVMSGEDRYASLEDIEVQSGKTTELGDVILKQEYGSIRVTTLNSETGESLPSCRIYLNRMLDDNFRTSSLRLQNNTTDQDGAWQSDKIVPDRYTLGANKDQYKTASKEITVVKGETNVLELLLEPGSTLNGIVVSGLTGEPIQRAEIKGFHGYPRIHTLTDEEGKFRLEGVIRGQGIRLVVSAENMASATKQVEIKSDEEWIEIVLDPGAWLAGVVETSEGEPLKDVNVYVYLKRYGGEISSDKTDAEGAFRLERLPQDEQLRLRAWKQGYENVNEDILEVNRDDMRLVMNPLSTFRLQVLHQDGSPLTRPFTVYRIFGFRRDKFKTVAYSEGMVVLGRLMPGRNEFEVRVGEHLGGRKMIEVTSGDQGRTETLTVRPLCRLFGSIRDESGDPVVGASLIVTLKKIDHRNAKWIMNQSDIRSESGPDGGFDLYFTDGIYTLFTDAEGYVLDKKEIVIAGEMEMEQLIVLKSGGKLFGTVSYEGTGEPAKDHYLWVSRESDQSSLNTHTDENGRYEFNNLLSGHYRFNVNTPANTSFHQKLVIEKGKDKNLDIVIPRIIEVTLVFKKGQYPPSRKYVNVYTNDEQPFTSHGRTDEHGRFKVSLPPGAYKVNMWELRFNDEFEILPADEGKEIVFNLSSGVLTLTLFDAETDEQITGCSGVSIRKKDEHNHIHGIKKDKGEFEFICLDAGEYVIHVNRYKNYLPFESEPVKLEQGEERNMFIRLEKGLCITVRAIDQETGEQVKEDIRVSAANIDNPNSLRWDYYPTETQENGDTRVMGLKQGLHQLRMKSNHYQSEIVECTIRGGENVELDIKASPMGAVLFRTIDAETGEPSRKNTRVKLTRGDFAMDYHVWRVQEYGPLEPGQYHYEMTTEGYAPQKGTILIKKRETTRLNLVMKSI